MLNFTYEELDKLTQDIKKEKQYYYAWLWVHSVSDSGHFLFGVVMKNVYMHMHVFTHRLDTSYEL